MDSDLFGPAYVLLLELVESKPNPNMPTEYDGGGAILTLQHDSLPNQSFALQIKRDDLDFNSMYSMALFCFANHLKMRVQFDLESAPLYSDPSALRVKKMSLNKNW